MKTKKIVFGTAESKLPQSGNVYSIGTGAFACCDLPDGKVALPVAIIKAHRNFYAITYAQQSRVAHLYLKEMKEQ